MPDPPTPTDEVPDPPTPTDEVPDPTTTAPGTRTAPEETTDPGSGPTEPLPLAVEVLLSQSAASGEVGTDLTWTATVYDGTAPVTGVVVHFRGQLAGEADVTETLTTDSSGSASLTHTRHTPGVESLVVTVIHGDEKVGDSGSFVWEPAASGVKIKIFLETTNGPVGEPVDVVATVTDDGEPLVGASVTFDSKMPGEEAMSQKGVTGKDGTVTFDHVRHASGEDTLTVATEPDGEVSASTTYTWRGALQVTMTAGDFTAPAGTPVQWTATVSGEESAAWVKGVEVRFLGRMPGEPDVDITLTTDVDGVATYTHTRLVPGTELLEVTATLGDESASDTGDFVWVTPVKIQLKPLDSSGLAGGSVDFVATVTAGGEPLGNEWVYFEAYFEDDFYPTTLSGQTNADGVVTFHHSRQGYKSGVDAITVWTNALGQFTTVDTTFTWRGPLRVTMSTSAETAPVGAEVEWTAIVSSDEASTIGDGFVAPAAWEEEVSVRFVARMDGQPDVDITLHPNDDGVVTYTHTRLVPGTEALEVTATVGDESTSDAGELVWEPAVEIAIEPVQSNGPVGVPVEFAATVTRGGEPLEDETVDFSARWHDEDEGLTQKGVTDADGVARFEHVRDEAGDEVILVETAAYDQEVQAETTFTWRDPLHVVLTAGSGSGAVGTPLEWTARVTSAGQGVPGATVHFLGQMAGQPDVEATLPTDADGAATHTHTRAVGGTESLQVTVTYGEETVSETGSFVWLDPDPVVDIQLEPLQASGPVEEPVEFVATVTGDGQPLAGELVVFTARWQGEVDGVSLLGITEADGTARFEHVRDETGIDIVTVETPAYGQSAWAETTFTWEPPLPVIVLGQSASSGEVGTTLVWTATLTVGDEPVSGASVRFLAELDGQPDLDVTVATNGGGVATFSHSRAVAGTESLLVGATVDGQTVFDTGSFEWLDVTPPVVEIAIAPLDASGQVGDNVQFVATVTADGQPLADLAVVFSAGMAGAPPVTSEDETDAGGVASFEHSRDVPGVDAITVETEALGQQVAADTTFTWQPSPPAPTPAVALSQSATSGVTGTPLTWTARVTSSGSPVDGASVRFLAQLPGADAVDLVLVTDATGRASHTHTRSVTGTESLQVSTTIAGQPLTASGSFTWLSVPGDPPPDPSTKPPADPPTGTTDPPAAQTPADQLPLPLPPFTPGLLPPTIPDVPGAHEGTTIGTEVDAPRSSGETPVPVPGGSLTTVALGGPSATPGGDLEVSGTGCEPNSTVVISLDGVTLATTTADSHGAFAARGAVAHMPLGQYAVDVQCGDIRGQASVDLVATAESSVAAAAAASAAAVLTFFVLLGSSAFRSTFGSFG